MPRYSASAVLSGGVFQKRIQRGCATWSYRTSRRLSVAPRSMCPAGTLAGPGGMWPSTAGPWFVPSPRRCRRRARARHSRHRSNPGTIPHVVERRGVEVRHRADRQRAVRMAEREQRAEECLGHLAERPILALALFVLHDAALLIEARLRRSRRAGGPCGPTPSTGPGPARSWGRSGSSSCGRSWSSRSCWSRRRARAA